MARLTRISQPNVSDVEKKRAELQAQLDALTAKPVAKPVAVVETGKALPKGKPFTFTFDAPAGHVSGNRTGIVYKGKSKDNENGVDVYVPLIALARELGYIPENVSFSITVTPHGKALIDPVAQVPEGKQGGIGAKKANYSEVYGASIGAYLAEIAGSAPQEAAPVLRAANDRKPNTATTAENDRLDVLEGMIKELAKAVLGSAKGRK